MATDNTAKERIAVARVKRLRRAYAVARLRADALTAEYDSVTLVFSGLERAEWVARSAWLKASGDTQAALKTVLDQVHLNRLEAECLQDSARARMGHACQVCLRFRVRLDLAEYHLTHIRFMSSIGVAA